MNFAEAAKNETKFTTTENGALALNTTSNALLDFYSVVGALRKADDNRIFRLFEEAYKEDPLYAVKALFYARDIRSGLGERSVFRKLLKYCADYHKEAIKNNITLIPEYGRYDDLYSLIGTDLEDLMWDYMKVRFASDLEAMSNNKPVSLLAKWVKSADASSPNTRKLGIYTAKKLGYTVQDFKKKYKSLRKYIDVTERKMSANQWGDINYSTVPSRCMLLNKNAFKKHDAERFYSFSKKAVNGDVKVNSGTLYPYDIIEQIPYRFNSNVEDDAGNLDILNAQWNQLPNYVEPGTNAIVVADTSGSMTGRPMNSAIALAIYFAQRNTGAYHGLWMTFSENPSFQTIKGERLEQIIDAMNFWGWGLNTDMEAAFDLILDTAIENKVPQEDMPKSIIVISDMEIDTATWGTGRTWTFYDKMSAKYETYGYKIPNVVFWNVKSSHDVYHSDATRKGVQLISGHSVSSFKNVIDCAGMTPVEAMYNVLNADRYKPISVG